MRYVLVFIGGVAAGLFIADQYAHWKINNTVQGGLQNLGLSPGAAGAVAPYISGLIG